jgi:hypothetical protein
MDRLKRRQHIIDFIAENIQSMSYSQLAKELNLSRSSIARYARDYNIPRDILHRIPKAMPITLLDNDYKFIKEYKSLLQMIKDINNSQKVSMTTLNHLNKGHACTFNKYILIRTVDYKNNNIIPAGNLIIDINKERKRIKLKNIRNRRQAVKIDKDLNILDTYTGPTELASVLNLSVGNMKSRLYHSYGRIKRYVDKNRYTLQSIQFPNYIYKKDLYKIKREIRNK